LLDRRIGIPVMAQLCRRGDDPFRDRRLRRCALVPAAARRVHAAALASPAAAS